MIVKNQTNWLTTLTTLQGSIARQIAKRCLAVTLIASLIVMIEQHVPHWFTPVSTPPFTLLGLSLSIFMSFRNNACYERWWEGRKMWGQVIIEMRGFARESASIEPTSLRESFVLQLCAYANALNARLRGNDEQEAARQWLQVMPVDSPHNVSNAILRSLGEQCAQLADGFHISEWRYMLLEQRLMGLTEAQANCERIKHTPLPFPYTLLLHRTTFMFCLLLPIALAQPLGWLAPVVTTLVCYTFFGLDAIGIELEDPFGYDENDLPTDAMVRNIERDLLSAIGRTNLPPECMPKNCILT